VCGVIRVKLDEKWLTTKAGTFLRSRDSWVVEEEQPGENKSYLFAMKVPAKIKPKHVMGLFLSQPNSTKHKLE
jgi:hypothetical protein